METTYLYILFKVLIIFLKHYFPKSFRIIRAFLHYRCRPLIYHVLSYHEFLLSISLPSKLSTPPVSHHPSIIYLPVFSRTFLRICSLSFCTNVSFITTLDFLLLCHVLYALVYLRAYVYQSNLRFYVLSVLSLIINTRIQAYVSAAHIFSTLLLLPIVN